jgi:hypothetical protein
MPHRAFDHLSVRCPRLGGEVTFGYCRELTDGLPCPRALVCFEHSFPVMEYFRRVLREETFHRIFVSPDGGADRISRLLDEVDRARNETPDD